MLYYEELFGTVSDFGIPESLLELLGLRAVKESTGSISSMLRKIAENCDEFHPLSSCSSPCRNFKVAYATSKHPQPSAPKEISEDLPELLQLEELLCAMNPSIVNTYLLRKRWGSGLLAGCHEGGRAIFFPSDARKIECCARVLELLEGSFKFFVSSYPAFSLQERLD